MTFDEMALRAALRGDNVAVKQLLEGSRRMELCFYCDSAEVELGMGNSRRCCDCGEQWEV